MTGPMDMTVSKDVVVAVKMILRVTNRLVTMTSDVKQDLLMMIAEKACSEQTYLIIFNYVYIRPALILFLYNQN